MYLESEDHKFTEKNPKLGKSLRITLKIQFTLEEATLWRNTCENFKNSFYTIDVAGSFHNNTQIYTYNKI